MSERRRIVEMKRKTTVLALIFVLMVSVALAEIQITLYKKITVGTDSSVSLTAPPEGCKEALIICESNDV